MEAGRTVAAGIRLHGSPRFGVPHWNPGTLDPLNPLLSRKVRAPTGKALANSEAAAGRPTADGKCHRNQTALRFALSASEGSRRVRVKKCGKSALSRVATSGMDKPCPVQDQTGKRAGPARYDSRVGRSRSAGNRRSRQMTVTRHSFLLSLDGRGQGEGIRVQNPAYRPASTDNPNTTCQAIRRAPW